MFLFCVHWCFACMSVWGHQKTWNWSCRWVWAPLWVLGIEPGSLEERLVFLTTEPPSSFLKVYFQLCVGIGMYRNARCLQRTEVLTLWYWGYRWLWAIWWGCWEPSSTQYSTLFNVLFPEWVLLNWLDILFIFLVLASQVVQIIGLSYQFQFSWRILISVWKRIV